MNIPPFIRSALSPLTIALLVLSVPLLVWSMLRAFDDPRGTDLWGNGMLVAPALVTAGTLFETMWARFDGNRIQVMFTRSLLVPTLAASLAGVTALAVSLVLGLPGSAGEWHYWFDPSGAHPAIAVAMIAWGAGLAVAVAILFQVLTPFLGFVHADTFVDFNYGHVIEADRPLARIAVRLIAMLVACLFPLVIAFAAGWWWLGVLFAAIAVGLTIATVIVQRRLGRSPTDPPRP